MPHKEPNIRETLRLEPGTLWSKVTERTEHALQCGALQPIPTEWEFVEQSGINFLVRILPNLIRKEAANKKQEEKKTTSKKEFNPFLPYDEDLFVTDISETHLCLLNKYNVLDHHLLIVTRTFEEQENLLNLQDFEAMWACLTEFDSLAFYNGGKAAGASQRHKHLQLVPLPITPKGAKLPIEPAINSAVFEDSVGKIPDFPFTHALVKLDSHRMESLLEAASYLLNCYHTLLKVVGLLHKNTASHSRQEGEYNLLSTKNWMLLVPRSQAEFESIPVNSLGFVGTLVVRSSQQMQFLKEQSPLEILKKVAVPIT
jgi:ATP adenylyltransferase